MSLFVNPQNQKLLWDMIHKNDLISRVFLNSSSHQKEEWFRTVIQLFYDQHMSKSQNRNITIRELGEMNRETLTYMNQKLRDYLTPNQNVNANSGANSGANSYANSGANASPTIITMPSKQESYNEQFQQRQKEYEQMNEKKAPDVLEFGEKIEDQPISNMEDLIQSHIKMREAELKQYSPPHVLPNQNTQKFNEVVPLVIDKKSNITVEIESLQEQEQDQEKSKKTVTWQIEGSDSEQMISDNNDNDNSSRSRLDKLEAIVLELSNKIETMILEIQSIKTSEKPI